jgi:hypothetical protein
MRQVYLIILFFILLLPSCKTKKADGVLPPEKMEAVLWDMMRADKFLADYVLNKDTTKKIDSESIQLYQQVLAIHQVTGKQFQKSFSYYKQHPDQLRGIMDSLSRPASAAPTEPVQPLPLPQQQPAGDTLQKKPDTTQKPSRIKKIMAID